MGSKKLSEVERFKRAVLRIIAKERRFYLDTVGLSEDEKSRAVYVCETVRDAVREVPLLRALRSGR